MTSSIVVANNMAMSSIDFEVGQPPARLSWLKRVVRYAVHVFVLYGLVNMTSYFVVWSFARLHSYNDQEGLNTSSTQFLVSHLLVISFVARRKRLHDFD